MTDHPDTITVAKCHPFRGDNFYITLPGSDRSGVEYIRADVSAARIADIERQLAEALAEVQALKAERDELARDGAGVFWANRARELAIHRKALSVKAEMRAEAAEAEVARLTDLLVSDREELLWNAYHTGHEKDGQWDHCCMSDGEWLARECGFDADQRVYPADAIKAAIPNVAARAALTTPEKETP